MTLPCRYCGQTFTPDRESLELYADGWIDRPDTCPDCGDYIQEPETDEFSDADPGL